MPTPWEQAKKIFGKALDQPLAERDEFVTQQCGDSTALKLEVDRLLELHASSGSFLAGPALETRDASQVFAPGTIVSDRFRIVNSIGHGGMGQVYEAIDVELGEAVALKTIRPELSADPGWVQRLKREVQLARRVSHRNVCRIHDFGTHHSAGSDWIFLSMELLRGPTLAQRLAEEKTLSGAEVLQLGQQIADGLDALHEAEIIHRDLKPANVILVADEQNSPRAVITDFGLACELATDTVQSNRSSDFAGTMGYMSPEQLQGGRVTPESDVYAFGLVLYEMLTGHRSFSGSGLEPRWRYVLKACLQVDPEERFAHAGDVIRAAGAYDETAGAPPPAIRPRRQELDGALKPAAPRGLLRRFVDHGRKRLLAGAATTGVLVALWGAWLLSTNNFRGSELPEQKHVAVLPFEAFSQDTALQALSDGLVETLTSKLTQLEQFRGELMVVPASEIRSSEISTIDEARRIYGANLVVTGSVQRWEDRLQVTANLVDASTVRQLDAVTLDIGAEELTALRDRLMVRVAGMLELELTPGARQQLVFGETRLAEAYRAYLEGRGYVQRYDVEGNIDKAVQSFESAIAIDDTYALAYSGLAEAFWRKADAGNDEQWAGKAIESAERAVAINGDLVIARVKLGEIYADSGREQDAVREFEQALKLNPSSAGAYQGLGRVHANLGNFSDAEASYRKAVELRPTDSYGYAVLAGFYSRQSRVDEAITTMQRAIALTPDNEINYRNLGTAYIHNGRYEQARESLETSLRIQPSSAAYGNLGVIHYFQGRYQEAAASLEMALELRSTNFMTWGNLADAYHWLPDSETKAQAAFQRAIELGRQRLLITPNDDLTRSLLVEYQAKMGDRKAALAEIDRMRGPDKITHLARVHMATAYEVIGMRNEAVEQMHIALGEGYSLDKIRRDPYLKGLWEDPSFQRGLER